MAEFYWDWTGEVAAEEEVTADETGDGAAAAAGHSGERSSSMGPPFGLKTGDMAVVGEVVAEHPELAASVQQLLAGPLAESTMKGYGGAVKKFQEFCGQHGYEYAKPTEKVMIHYLASLNEAGTSFAVLCQVRPAVQLLMDLAGGSEEVFTARVNRMLEAAKRRAAERKEPVKKAGEIKLETLKAMVEKHITPFEEDIFRINVFWLRTIVRVVVEYYTFCRLADYRHLRALHVEDRGGHLEVKFPKSKADQYHRGNVTVLAANESGMCPVKIVRIYFRRFGLRFGQEQGDQTPLHFRIRRVGGLCYADKKYLASESLAREELQALLRDMGVETEKVTDKSFKMLGVTETLQAGVPVQEVALHGRWRTAEMPLRYKHNSDRFKLELAAKIPH